MAAEWPYHITDQVKALHLAMEPDCQWRNDSNCSLYRTVGMVLAKQEKWVEAQRENVDFLSVRLGPKVVLYMSDGRSLGETAELFRAGREVFEMISAAEGDDVARAWMIGMNPHLDDESPILTLQQKRCAEVLRAGRSYLAGQWT